MIIQVNKVNKKIKTNKCNKNKSKPKILKMTLIIIKIF